MNSVPDCEQLPRTNPSDEQLAIALLLVSGTLSDHAGELDPGDRVLARQHRRETVVLGAQLLSEAVGGPGVYENQYVDGAASEQLAAEILSWFSTRPRSAPHTRKMHADDVEKVQRWLRLTVALLRGSRHQRSERKSDFTSALIRTVARPLCEALVAATQTSVFQTRTYFDLGKNALELGPVSPSSVETELVNLAVDIGTEAGGREALIQEAAAGLSRLVQAGPLAAEPDFLRMIVTSSSVSPRIAVCVDGPYVFEGEADVTNHLGVPVKFSSRAAFCRCGQSSAKPFCDGSHAAVGFSGDKDPHRVADARDTYLGQQAKIYDNRGICAHSGFCTDRLRTVFHVGEEPFVTPSGGRLDDIMRAVRRCPSGALSVGLNQIEDRAYVDSLRSAAIEISKDGPYRIIGGIALSDERGVPVPRATGSSLEHYSLCRCGSSLNKPFCSGMHWSVQFADPRPPADWEPTLFEWAGGYPALLDMTQVFYGRHVPSDPVVGPLFARMEADHPERVAAWLSEVFGGPAFYSERYGGYSRMISQHLDKHLTQEQRSHWAMLMAQSADEAGLPNDPEFQAAFMSYIEWGSRIAVENSMSGAKPTANMPVPRWWWVCNATPNSRVSAIAPVGGQPSVVDMPMLAAGERPSFEKHIKGLFRPMDRNSMKFAFDLWTYEDVRTHADAILARVKAGTMPCDKAWAPEKVSLFQHWTEEGRDA